MPKKHVWLSFDLGIQGDYEGMYTFLDNLNAKECNTNLSFFSYEYKFDLFKELSKELKQSLSLDKRSRVYIVFPTDDGKYVGKFLSGKRKAPPWAGYGAVESGEVDVGE